jgi:hypothetical protein
MKNTILVTGGLLIFLNTLCGLILSFYPTFNMVFGDISILISAGILYFLFKSSINDGFKIGLSLLFVLSGLIRFICAVASIQQLENNISLLVFSLFVVLEIIGLLLTSTLSKKIK